MRSIKQKLLVRILAMAAAAALICGGVGIAANYISSHSMLEQSLESTASLAATRVSYELLSYQNAVRGLGMVPELSDGAVPVTEKERIVDHWAQSYGMERGNLRAGACLTETATPNARISSRRLRGRSVSPCQP